VWPLVGTNDGGVHACGHIRGENEAEKGREWAVMAKRENAARERPWMTVMLTCRGCLGVRGADQRMTSARWSVRDSSESGLCSTTMRGTEGGCTREGGTPRARTRDR